MYRVNKLSIFEPHLRAGGFACLTYPEAESAEQRDHFVKGKIFGLSFEPLYQFVCRSHLI